jgi:HEPN domain-containing protein
MSLYSWDYEADHPADEWLWMAHAYADVSVALFEGMEAGSLPMQFHHAKVAAAAFDQGLELFLKGALVLAGDDPPVSHRLAAVLDRFRKAFPGVEFGFTGKIDEAVRTLPTQPVGQFLRYPVNTKGEPWPGHSHFDLGIWLGEARAFRADYRRLEPLLRRNAKAQKQGKT